MDWKKDLKSMLIDTVQEEDSTKNTTERHQEQVNKFFSLFIEAFEEIGVELEGYGRRVQKHTGECACAIEVYHDGRVEFSYAVKVRKYMPAATGEYSFYNANRFDARTGAQHYTIATIHQVGKQRIIEDFTLSYMKHLKDRLGNK